jgi:hypothetical protein
VDAQQDPGAAVEDQFEQPVLAGDDTAWDGAEFAAPGHVRDPLGFAVFLALADTGYLGQPVHRGGRDLIDVRGEVEAERPAHRLTPLVRGDRGQRRTDDVAGREDPRAARPPLGVDDDPAAPIDPHPGLLQTEARGADAAARGEQQRVRAQLAPIIQCYGQVVAVAVDGDHAGAEDHLVPARHEDLLEAAGDLGVHHGGQPWGGVEDGDGHAERGEDGGVLDPDRTASHDQQLAGLERDIRDGLRVEDERIIERHAGGTPRARSGGDDGPVGVQPPLAAIVDANHHRVIGVQPRRAAHQIHADRPDTFQRRLHQLLADRPRPGQEDRVPHPRRRG